MLRENFPSEGRKRGFLSPLAEESRWVSARVAEQGLLASLPAVPTLDKIDGGCCSATVTSGAHKLLESFQMPVCGSVNHGHVSDMVGFDITHRETHKKFLNSEENLLRATTAWMMMAAAQLLEERLAEHLCYQLRQLSRRLGQTVRVDTSVITADNLLSAIFQAVKQNQELGKYELGIVIRPETWEFLLSARPEHAFEGNMVRGPYIWDRDTIRLNAVIDTGIRKHRVSSPVSDFYILPMSGSHYQAYLTYQQYTYQYNSHFGGGGEKENLSLDILIEAQPATSDDRKVKWTACQSKFCVSLTAESCVRLEIEAPEILIGFNAWHSADQWLPAAVDIVDLPGLRTDALSPLERVAI